MTDIAKKTNSSPASVTVGLSGERGGCEDAESKKTVKTSRTSPHAPVGNPYVGLRGDRIMTKLSHIYPMGGKCGQAAAPCPGP